MQFRTAAILFAVFAPPAMAVMLEGSKPVEKLSPNASAHISQGSPTAADVAKLHQKLERIVVGLDGLLSSKQHGSLADTKIAPTLQGFAKEVRATLDATASPKDLPAAMKQLQAAQAGVADLMIAMSKQQESLMSEDATEQTNLLLGVLMTKKGEPMEKQLAVLSSADFRDLPISAALLAKHDSKVPLFQQAAAYEDAHGAKFNATTLDTKAQKAQKLAKTVAYFEQRSAKLEREEEAMKAQHQNSTKRLDDLIAKSQNKSVHHLMSLRKRSEREFKKQLVTHQQETKMMKDVVASLKRGDPKALIKARDAMQAFVDRMKSRSGDFLYLLELGHSLVKRDCPFCVAQCIGKCHDAGQPYAICMTQCATAGQ